MLKDPLKLSAFLFFALLGGLIIFLLSKDSTPQLTVQRAALGGDFTLESPEGPVSLSDFEGGPVLIYFGFTSCPDICPTSLAVMRHSFTLLSDEELSKVNALFITVDPERDTLEHLKTYTHFFSPKITGVTGSREEIDLVVAQYGAYYRFVELENSAMDYTVDHSSRIYLVDSQGKLVTTVPHDSSPAVLAEKIKALL